MQICYHNCLRTKVVPLCECSLVPLEPKSASRQLSLVHAQIGLGAQVCKSQLAYSLWFLRTPLVTQPDILTNYNMGRGLLDDLIHQEDWLLLDNLHMCRPSTCLWVFEELLGCLSTSWCQQLGMQTSSSQSMPWKINTSLMQYELDALHNDRFFGIVVRQAIDSAVNMAFTLYSQGPNLWGPLL